MEGKSTALYLKSPILKAQNLIISHPVYWVLVSLYRETNKTYCQTKNLVFFINQLKRLLYEIDKNTAY